MVEFLNASPRTPHHIQRDSPLAKEFQKLFAQTLQSEGQVKRMGVQIPHYGYYEEPQAVRGHKILISANHSRLMELYIFLGALLYLIGLFYLF
mmetsp:Transcript_40295/g.29701  ORF Transcript_40295/g.29701 Transcript_40295/m.29701 type:complete len:93 (+) Transcript_40295:1349-1627(+)